MPVVTNMAELEKALKDEIAAAMNEIDKEALKIMKEETKSFYSWGPPLEYKRTHALEGTPKTDGVQETKKGYKIKYYLDHKGRQYSTGDNPNMLQVLHLANYGTPWTTKSGATAKPTVGMPGFWERADERIKDMAYEEFADRFS